MKKINYEIPLKGSYYKLGTIRLVLPVLVFSFCILATINTYAVNNRFQIYPLKKSVGHVVSTNEIIYITKEQDGKKLMGIVTDSKGEPIPGATVVVKGTNNGTITNNEGEFVLEVSVIAQKLLISFIGYAPQDITIGQRTEFKIQLIEATQSIDEVVVVGYGTQKKETVTGAISTIKSEDIVEAPVANISNAIIGRISGVSGTQSSGEPGKNATNVRIRGVGTLNGSGQQPLVIIDGVQSTLAAMNELDPNEIENISVLKDVSATAIYGVKGANGVFIITTKRGTTGSSKVTFSANFGVTKLATYLKMLDSYTYALYRNEAIRNDNDPSLNSYLLTEAELWKFKNNRDYTPEEVMTMFIPSEQKDELLNSPALYYTSQDYFKEQFGRLSPQQQYNLNISGGDNGIKYFTSIGYFSQEGVFQNSDYGGVNVNSFYERYNFRSNLDIDLVKNLKASFDVSGKYSIEGGVLGGEADGSIVGEYGRHKAMLVNILQSPPFAGPGIVDGHLVTKLINNPLEEKGAAGFSPIAGFLVRPYLTSYNSNLNTRIKLEHIMDYMLKGLSLSGTVAYNGSYTKGIYRENSIIEYTAVRNPENLGEVLFLGGKTGPKKLVDNYNNYKWRRIYLETKLNYANTFNKHSINGLILYNAQKTYDPGLLYHVPSGLIGLAGRITYSFSDTYLAEVNVGYNGSENFPEKKRFGFFPAVSLGWVISNMENFSKENWITWLKIRGSYGVVGNDNIGGRRFLYLPSAWGYNGDYALGGYSFGDTNGASKDPYYVGASESSVGNPDVTWEKARKANIAVELNLFKNRLSFVGDIFKEKRDNILWYLGTVPALVGADLPPANIGKVSNKGFETQLGWGDKVREFRYGINLNVSYAKNKIEFKDEPANQYEWMNETGYSIGQYKGLRTNGFYNTDTEVANHPYSDFDGNKVKVGDLRYIDINGDGKLDAKDYVPVGYSNVPRYSFGANIFVDYKGFSLSMLFTGTAQGSLMMRDFYLRNPFHQLNGTAMQFQYEGRWTPEKVAQGIEPTFPRASVRTWSSINGVDSDFWVKSTDHIRLKNVEIGYTFTNPRLLKRIGIRKIRTYISGNNLYTWSKLIDGIDPEQQDSDGSGSGYLYPMTKVYNLGFSVEF